MARPRAKTKSLRTTQSDAGGATDFGARLRDARLNRGLTLRDLSAASEVSIAYLSDLERGVLVNPTLDTLRAIGKALDASLNELLGLDEEEASSPRLPKTLEEFRDVTPFRQLVAEDAGRANRDVDELEAEWLKTLAAIQVAGRRPKTPSDYLFIFEAIRRAVDRR